MIDTSSFSGKSVGVYGLGMTGKAVIRALSPVATLYIGDDSKTSVARIMESEQRDRMHDTPYDAWPWESLECLVLSAGIPLTHPEPHPIVAYARAANCTIMCDIELLYACHPDATYICITGTNGKSTTTALIGHVLQSLGYPCQVGGNIGRSGADLEPLGSDGIYVIEMSSYQLDLIVRLRANVAVLLNITPDHLDRHGDMDGYIAAKCRLFDCQKDDDIAVIGVGTPESEAIANALEPHYGERCKKIAVDANVPCHIGYDGHAVFGTDIDRDLALVPPARLPGQHNAENIAAVIAVMRYFKADMQAVMQALHSFEGLPHRLETVRIVEKTRFVNDSKATNGMAAQKALDVYDRDVFWIVGGVAKDDGLTALEQYFSRISHAYLIGQSQQDFASYLQGKVSLTCCDTLKDAVIQAWQDAQKLQRENTVLFSPACASFDQWKNFEERGGAFRALVEQL